MDRIRILSGFQRRLRDEAGTAAAIRSVARMARPVGRVQQPNARHLCGVGRQDHLAVIGHADGDIAVAGLDLERRIDNRGWLAFFQLN